MGSRLLLFFVIYQTVFIISLSGVTLPLSDSIGVVTPIKPKPLSATTVSSSATSSSLVCENGLPKLITPATKGAVNKEFSSPLALTSSSIALPVPKIDSLSIENVKIPETLKEKFSSVCKAPVRKIKPDLRSPDVSLPNKYKFLSSPIKLPNASPNSLSDMCSSPIDKLSPLPSIKSLPNVLFEPLKPNGFDLLSSSSKANKFSASSSITTCPKSQLFDSLSTSEVKKPSFGEYFTTNSFSPLSSSCSLQYPLQYKSMHLPGVRTSSEPLSFNPRSYKNAGNFDLPRLSSSYSLLSSKTLDSDFGLNVVLHKNEPYSSPHLNTVKTSQILKPIQVPKTSSNVPVSTMTMSSAQNVAAKNLWNPKEVNYGSASVAFESKLKPSEYVLSSLNLRCDENPFQFMPNLGDDRNSEFNLKPCIPLKIKPASFTSPKNFINWPATPLVPLSPTSSIVDVSSNRLNTFDSSKNIDTPNMIPVLGTHVETKERLNPNDLGSNFQTHFDSKNIPSLSSDQHPSFTKECVSIPLNYSQSIILPVPIVPSVSETSSLSPITYCPSRTSQTSTTPVSYIKLSPSSSITQATSNMVSSITNLVSNIVQNILYSYYKSYIRSAPQNIPQIPTYTIHSNPYADTVLKPEKTLSVVPLPQGNLLNTISVPVISVSTDNLNAPTSDSSTIITCKLSASEVSSSQPILISSPQFSSPKLPPSSLITSSSPQLCPSYLSSPIIPSYTAIAPPFFMEAPILKISSSKKDSDVENLIELMLLAEILNNDESIDWDEIDTLLAFLSLS